MSATNLALFKKRLATVQQTQWLADADAVRRQRRALARLLAQAKLHTPFYRNRLNAIFSSNGSLNFDAWHDLPLVSRSDVLDHGDEFKSNIYPKSHGAGISAVSSGTTGSPIIMTHTERSHLVAAVDTLLAHLWHDIDRNLKLAHIGPFADNLAAYPNGAHYPDWGEISRLLGYRGEMSLLNINAPVDQQLTWLTRENPDYLHTFPVNLHALAQHAISSNSFLKLKKVTCIGEPVTADIREACRAAFGAEIVNQYGSIESGFIAVQCPMSEQLHCWSATALVEILDEDNFPCAPGASGQIVVTPLHNFATPLIRYQTGDHAVTGVECGCGRNLPIIAEIKGRTRNMFRFGDGAEVWLDFKSRELKEFLQPRQWQIAQTGPFELEIRYVPLKMSHHGDHEGMTAYVNTLSDDNLTVRYKILNAFPKQTGGKFHTYIREIE